MRTRGFSIIITGLGGHGVLTLSKTIAAAAMKHFNHIALLENRGMSQRGGAVVCQVRFGSTPVCPVISTQDADLILSLDCLESVRLLPMLAPTGVLLTDVRLTPPASLAHSDDCATSLSSQLLADLAKRENAYAFDFKQSLPARLGKFLNAALLGAASGYVPLNTNMILEEFRHVVPKETHSQNLEAFEHGHWVMAARRSILCGMAS